MIDEQDAYHAHKYPEWLQAEADEYIAERSAKEARRLYAGCIAGIVVMAFIWAAITLIDHATAEDPAPLPTTREEAGRNT